MPDPEALCARYREECGAGARECKQVVWGEARCDNELQVFIEAREVEDGRYCSEIRIRRGSEGSLT